MPAASPRSVADDEKPSLNLEDDWHYLGLAAGSDGRGSHSNTGRFVTMLLVDSGASDYILGRRADSQTFTQHERQDDKGAEDHRDRC